MSSGGDNALPTIVRLRHAITAGADQPSSHAHFWDPMFIRRLGTALWSYFCDEDVTNPVTNEMMARIIKTSYETQTLYESPVPGWRCSLSEEGDGESYLPEVGKLKFRLTYDGISYVETYEKGVCFDFGDDTDDLDTPWNAVHLIKDLKSFFLKNGWSFLMERANKDKHNPLWLEATDIRFDDDAEAMDIRFDDDERYKKKKCFNIPEKGHYRWIEDSHDQEFGLSKAQYLVRFGRILEISAICLSNKTWRNDTRVVITRCPPGWVPPDYKEKVTQKWRTQDSGGAQLLQLGGGGADESAGARMGRPIDWCIRHTS